MVGVSETIKHQTANSNDLLLYTDRQVAVKRWLAAEERVPSCPAVIMAKECGGGEG